MRYHKHNTKLSKQHHDKKTVNVKVYQNTKIDTQIHITEKKSGEDGGTLLERSATHVTGDFNLV